MARSGRSTAVAEALRAHAAAGAPAGGRAASTFEYGPRRVWSRPPVALGGARMKPYELRFAGRLTGREPTPADWPALLALRPPRPDDALDHAVGFAIMHYAKDGDYLLVSRWHAGNTLKHEVWAVTESAEGWRRTSLADTRMIACVWELEIIHFERNAWVRTVMAKDGTAAAVDEYLHTAFNGWI